MTDPISPAEAAAAAAIDANLTAAGQAQTVSAQGTTDENSDLLGAEPTEEQIAAATEHAHHLEAQLAAIKAKKAGQTIPHAAPTPHVVPAAVVPQATDKPVVHHTVGEQPQVSTHVLASAEPIKEVPVSYSAKLAAIQASGVKPVKKQYKYKRNR